MPPPPIVKPSDGDVNRGGSLLAALWATTVIALLFVVSRLFVRIKVIRYHGWDDYWIIVSILLGLGGVILDTIAVDHGLGRHEFYLTMGQITEATKYNFIAIPFNLMSSAFAKISVCFFLLHVNQNKTAAYVLYGLSVTLFVFASATCILLFAQCSPVAALWTPSLRGIPGACLPPSVNANFGLAQSIFFCIADVAFALFPLTFLWNLKMNRRTKLALGFVLSLGLIAAAFGVVRCVDLNEIGSREDILFSTVDLAIWSFLEQNVTIIAACIPVLYTVFRTVLGNRSTNAGTRQTPNSHGNNYSEGKRYLSYGTGSKAVRGKFPDDIDLDVRGARRGRDNGTGWEGSTRAGSGDLDLDDVEAAKKGVDRADATSEDGILENPQPVYGGSPTKTGGIMRTTEVRVTSDDKGKEDKDRGLTRFMF